METEASFIYLGIPQGQCAQNRKVIMQNGLPIRKMDRKFPFLLREGRNITGNIQIYYAFLPEYEKGQNRFFKSLGPKKWTGQVVQELFGRASDRAREKYDCREWIYGPESGGEKEELPVELIANCLYRQRPFEKVCISLPDKGEYAAEQALWLLAPYLSRIKRVALCGEEGLASELLGEELYAEYGIMMENSKRPEQDMLWLDLRDNNERRDHVVGCSSKTKCVNSAETLKFLDTMVKNGYNTKVN